MTTFLCGPDGAVNPEDLPVADRAAIANFEAFLRGGAACPVCLDPVCTKADPCCPDCPGFHIRGGRAPVARVPLEE